MNALLLIYLATLSGYFAISPDFSYKQHNRGGFATVNDIQLHYERYGQGQPLLLLHGNAQAVDFLCLQIPALAQHFDVIAVDTRAHGQSASGDEPLSFELLAADLDALLQWLAIPSAHIVGWSDGGNIGLVTALRYPHRVNRLVTMAANIFMDESVVGEEMMAEARRMLASAEQDDEPASQHIARLVRLSLYHPRYRFEDLQAIACPVLVMAGETDVIKRSHTEAIAAHIPNARLHIARGETHHYPVRNPDGFNQTVIDFLTDDRLTGPL